MSGTDPDPIARARSIAPLLEAAAPRIEAACELPPDVLAALHQARLFRTLLPAAYGGEEIEPAIYVQMLEVIAAADASAAWCIGQGSGCSMSAAYLDAPIATEIWGAADAVLAWGAGPAGVARVVDGGYVVTGRWSFASGLRHATWLGGHCRVQDRDGTMRTVDGALIERTMLFRKQQAAIVPNWEVIGLRGTGSDTYSVQDLFVAEAYTVGRDDPAERRLPGTLYCFTGTHLYASGFAGVALGIARASLDAFVVLTRDKAPRGATRVLRDNAVVQRHVALAEAKLGSASAWLLQTLREIWAGAAQSGTITADQRMRLRLASTFASHQAREVVDMAYHEAGATAIFDANPFERRFRDMHTVSQQVQARASHFETVGQHLLGLPAGPAFI